MLVIGRKEQLLNIFDNDDLKAVLTPIVSDVVFLEEKLEELRKLPFIRVSEKNQAMQKATPASKMYKEFLQQYNNCIKTLTSLIDVKEIEGEDALLEGIKMLRERYESY